MGKIKYTLPAIRLVRRESAEWYMLLTLVSFAGSVTVTRLFLSLSGYPQIGGVNLHIAHVLWGGLLLYIGALLPLIFSNRGVYPSGAILAGTGVGLFIDEVGKFITKSNDYFSPLAAPIIYVLFLLSIIFLINVRRKVYVPKSIALSQALDDLSDSLREKPSAEEWEQMKTDLGNILEEPSSPQDAELARALLKFVEAKPVPLRMKPVLHIRLSKKLTNLAAHWLPERRLRWLLSAGLFGIGVVMWKEPLSIQLSGWFGGRLAAFLTSLHIGRQIATTSAPGLSDLRLVLEVLTGLLLVAAAVLLLTRHRRRGAAVGIIGLLVSLTSVDLLLFYFEQFSTVITTLIQFLVLVGLIYYRRLISREA